MKPKAVIFDLGKVLVHFDWSIAARRMSPRCNLSPEQLLKVFDYSPLVVEYELGRITNDQFYSEAVRMTGFQGDIHEFATLFGEIFTEMEEMTALHAELRRRNVPTFIFSNTNDFAVQSVRAAFPFFAHFDGYVLSYEHGAMKPQPKLYEVVEGMSGCSGGELLYIDDRHENIEAGRARGWQVILQEQPATTIAAVRQTGLLD